MTGADVAESGETLVLLDLKSENWPAARQSLYKLTSKFLVPFV
jgi:hypothetical protein